VSYNPRKANSFIALISAAGLGSVGYALTRTNTWHPGDRSFPDESKAARIEREHVRQSSICLDRSGAVELDRSPAHRPGVDCSPESARGGRQTQSGTDVFQRLHHGDRGRSRALDPAAGICRRRTLAVNVAAVVGSRCELLPGSDDSGRHHHLLD
jgi:hypothetical protein